MTDNQTPKPARPVPSSEPVLRQVLKWGGYLAIGIAVIGSIVGYLFAGWIGVTSALIGTAMAVVFLGVTAASILLANRFSGSEMFVGAFFGIVLGGWLLKFVLFLILAFALKGQPWINPAVMFLSLIAGVIGSLVVDVLVVFRSRMPYASDVTLPGENPKP